MTRLPDGRADAALRRPTALIVAAEFEFTRGDTTVIMEPDRFEVTCDATRSMRWCATAFRAWWWQPRATVRCTMRCKPRWSARSKPAWLCA